MHTVCPACGMESERVYTPNGTWPPDGAPSICCGCLNLCFFVNGPLGQTLRVATADEQLSWGQRQEYIKARDEIRAGWKGPKR